MNRTGGENEFSDTFRGIERVLDSYISMKEFPEDGIIKKSFLSFIKKGILAECGALALLGAACLFAGREGALQAAGESTLSAVRESMLSAVRESMLPAAGESTPQKTEEKKEPVKWVDFTVSYEALCKAYDWDVDTHGTENEVDWVELLAYTAAKTGGVFDKKALSLLDKTAEELAEGSCTLEELTEDLKYYAYYKEAYDAVLGGLVGEYEEETEDENGRRSYQPRYGLKGYFPLARGFDYSHYDDFGSGRSYGYKRKHLGHDMMGLVGTPIVAVESGVVEALGWNQYGGWRIGIRSFDGRRYYYYAHLRQNYPYAQNLEEGSVVTAGDVIGYMGHTGYSTKENVNNIEVTHLHWGLELIFDEKRREEGKEIWVDVYPLTRFLAKHTQPAEKVEGTKEWVRTNAVKDPAVEAYQKERK